MLFLSSLCWTNVCLADSPIPVGTLTYIGDFPDHSASVFTVRFSQNLNGAFMNLNINGYDRGWSVQQLEWSDEVLFAQGLLTGPSGPANRSCPYDTVCLTFVPYPLGNFQLKRQAHAGMEAVCDFYDQSPLDAVRYSVFGSGARAGKFSFGRYRAAGAGRNEEENQAMRLSQAILLGSTLLRPVAGDLELPGDCGALGMAERAVGAGWSYWPWLLTMRLAAPCRCPFQPLPAAWVVTHLFGCHVAEEFLDSFRNKGWVRSDDRWTLEQLVDWVRSVEPAEAETGRRASAPCTV